MLRNIISLAMENSLLFALSQKLIPFTDIAYKKLISRQIKTKTSDNILDVGCGVGAYANFFEGSYTGIDFSGSYIDHCKKKHPEATFFQVRAGSLPFKDERFDHILYLAVMHHISDEEIKDSLKQSKKLLSRNGKIHVIDPVLIETESFSHRNLVFNMDRGRYQRTELELRDVLAQELDLVTLDSETSLLHYIRYFQLQN